MAAAKKQLAPPGLPPATAAQAAAEQRAIAADLVVISTLTIESAEDLAGANELLTDIVRRRDKVVSMRTAATGPMRTAIKVVEEWFRPSVKDFDAAVLGLKKCIERYNLAQHAIEAQARAAAIAAAAKGDSASIVKHIGVAEDARMSVRDAGVSATLGWGWEVIDISKVPPEYTLTVPNEKRLADLAKANAKSDTPPHVPGILFTRKSNVRAKH